MSRIFFASLRFFPLAFPRLYRLSAISPYSSLYQASRSKQYPTLNHISSTRMSPFDRASCKGQSPPPSRSTSPIHDNRDPWDSTDRKDQDDTTSVVRTRFLSFLRFHRRRTHTVLRLRLVLPKATVYGVIQRQYIRICFPPGRPTMRYPRRSRMWRLRYYRFRPTKSSFRCHGWAKTTRIHI